LAPTGVNMPTWPKPAMYGFVRFCKVLDNPASKVLRVIKKAGLSFFRTQLD
jgi:hypothetical protein